MRQINTKLQDLIVEDSEMAEDAYERLMELFFHADSASLVHLFVAVAEEIDG
jgi:hypothetical protein